MSFNFTILYLFTISLLLAISSTIKGQTNQAPERPNILWIIAEDLSPDLACYGNTKVRTPNLDLLAANGMRFENAFTTAPVCAPSRTALAVGMYQTTINAHHMRYPDRLKNELPEGVVPVHELFKRHGYQTALITDPPGRAKTDWSFATPYNRFEVHRWEELSDERPFFAVVNLRLTHRPFERDTVRPIDPASVNLPPYYPDHPVAREDFAAYLESVQLMDGLVGQVLSTLDERGLQSNTIIIFLGDHGRPMSRGKNNLYDSGIQIPLIMTAPPETRWASELLAGSTYESLVSAIDITATSLAFAGIDKPERMQGRVLLGPDKERERSEIYAALDRIGESHFKSRTVRTAQWKYIRNDHRDRSVNEMATAYRKAMHPIYHLLNLYDEKGLLTPIQQALVRPMPKEELYYLPQDAYEVRNLAEDPQYAGQLTHLRNQVEQWQQSTEDHGMQEDPQELVQQFEDYGEKSQATYQQRISDREAEVRSAINKHAPGQAMCSLNGDWKFNTFPGEGSNYLDIRPQAGDIVIDNQQTDFLDLQGDWQLAHKATRETTAWNGDYLQHHFTEQDSAYVRFRAEVPESGYYEHFINYPFGNHLATMVQVKHAEGIHSKDFNQKNRPNHWLSLGVFKLEKGGDHYIEFTAATKGTAVADVVLLRPVETAAMLQARRDKQKAHQIDFDDSGWDNLKVPGHYGMINSYANYSGKAWYRREFALPRDWTKEKEERIRLRFEGVYHVAEVYLNEAYIGRHQGGFTPFEFDVTEQLNYNSDNLLAVETDNNYLVGATWNWGGIIREVKLIKNKDIRINFQYIHAEPDLQTGSADYTINMRIENSGKIARSLAVSAVIHKGEALDTTAADIEVPPNSIRQLILTGQLTADQVALWHFDRPELYDLHATIREGEQILHQKTDRFGIRKFEATADQMLLNGEAVRLVGFNRVSDHRYWGSSEPQGLIDLDVDLMKTAGANFMRIMHGTQNERLIERCDEKGILLFEEVNVRDLRMPEIYERDYHYPKQWMREMIERDINHPSIVGWSVGNELTDHFDYVKMAYAYAKELDPHRLALHVSNRGYGKEESPANNPLAYGDMIFQNIYQPDPGAVMDTLHARWPDRVMFFSEFGVARFTTPDLDHDLPGLGPWYDHLRGQRPYTTGASIWTFNDYKSGYSQTLADENRAWGMVNAWRTKRRAFATHQKENSPVKDLSITRIDLQRKTADVSFRIRDPDDFPSYTMRGYYLRYTLKDRSGKILSEGRTDLPTQSPGMGHQQYEISWEGVTDKAFELHLSLLSPNGYARVETKIYFDVPQKPVIQEVKASDEQLRIHFDKNFGAFEHYLAYTVDGEQEKSPKTIANYIDLDRLPTGADISFQLIACNSQGESMPSETIRIETRGNLLAPVIWDGFIMDDQLIVGYSGDWEDQKYTVRYGRAKDHLNKTETTNARGIMIVPLQNESSVYFQIKRTTAAGESQWSNIVFAQKGKFRIYE